MIYSSYRAAARQRDSAWLRRGLLLLLLFEQAAEALNEICRVRLLWLALLGCRLLPLCPGQDILQAAELASPCA